MMNVTLTTIEAKREALLQALPDHDWSIRRAAQAVGYSKSYATTTLPAMLRKDKRFCQRVIELRQSLEATTLDRRAACLKILSEISADPDMSPKDRISAIREEASICGWHKETTVIETEDRLEQLDDARADMARRAAIAVFDTTKELGAGPGHDSTERDVVEGNVIGDSAAIMIPVRPTASLRPD